MTKQTRLSFEDLAEQYPELKPELTLLMNQARDNVIVELNAVQSQGIKLSPAILHAIGVYNNKHATTMIEKLKEFSLNTETHLLQLLALDHIHWGNFLNNTKHFFATRKLPHETLTPESFSQFANAEHKEVIKAMTDENNVDLQNSAYLYKILRFSIMSRDEAKSIRATLKDRTDLKELSELIEQMGFLTNQGRLGRFLPKSALDYLLENPSRVQALTEALRNPFITQETTKAQPTILVDTTIQEFAKRFANPKPILDIFSTRKKIRDTFYGQTFDMAAASTMGAMSEFKVSPLDPSKHKPR